MVHKASEHRIAVIDIGSNSVRLVVFEGEGRFPAVAFNEKVLCGIGRTVPATGILDEDGMVLALQTLERFSILLDRMKVKDIRAVATAAVREATNGAAFISAIESRCGFAVRVITGPEEARYSALGVLAGLPAADGLVGDLGGGSLEVVEVHGGSVHENATLPLGPFILNDIFRADRKAALARIDTALASMPWLERCRDRDFYAVGGSWRAVARIHMEQAGYPLHILHNYTIERRALMQICDLIMNMSPQSLVRLRSLPNRRVETLPVAAAVLKRIFALVQPSRFVVSALGLREGLIYDGMSEDLRKRDPLLDACHEIAEQSGRFPEHAQKLLEWTAPLFPDETAADRRLRLATCMLSDVAWRGHPDYRAEKVLMEVLYGRFGALDHRGAAVIALALYICYGGNLGQGVAADLERILDAADVTRARVTGLALRLGQRLSGGTSSALKLASLCIEKDMLVLRVKVRYQAFAGEVVSRRLEALAKSVGLGARIVPE